MAIAQSLWTELGAALEQASLATRQLKQLLEQEREALEQRDYETFQRLISDKHQALTQLEHNTASRQQLLLSAGFEDESNALAAAQQQAPTIANAWQLLEREWRTCQELNEINDRIAQRTRLVVGQVLDALRGHSGSSKLYNHKGNTQHSGSGRTISNA